MKKFAVLLFVMTLGLGLTSCNSDDDDNLPNYTVVGKWKISEYTINGASAEDCENKGVRQFKNDGTYLQDDYELNPQTEQCQESEDSPLIGTYTKTTDKVTMMLGGVTKTFDLEFVDSNKFILTETFNNVDFVRTYTRL